MNSIIENQMNCSVSDITVLGKGASASVYKVLLDQEPYTMALKVSSYPDLIKEEYDKIKFISDRVDCKLPKLYFLHIENNIAYLGMELIEGVEASRNALLFKPHKRRLANEIVDNLIKIHSVHNDTFGPVNHAVYATWSEYYREFAKSILDFVNSESTETPDIVKKAVRTAYNRLDEILADCSSTPTLIHGDYWLPNFIIDTKAMHLKGIIDPFNVMWAEPEYELFQLTVGYGQKLHLYEIYKSKVAVSENCDIKLEMYALFNELLWYSRMGTISFSYLEYRSKRLLEFLG